MCVCVCVGHYLRSHQDDVDVDDDDDDDATVRHDHITQWRQLEGGVWIDVDATSMMPFPSMVLALFRPHPLIAILFYQWMRMIMDGSHCNYSHLALSAKPRLLSLSLSLSLSHSHSLVSFSCLTSRVLSNVRMREPFFRLLLTTNYTVSSLFLATTLVPVNACLPKRLFVWAS